MVLICSLIMLGKISCKTTDLLSEIILPDYRAEEFFTTRTTTATTGIWLRSRHVGRLTGHDSPVGRGSLLGVRRTIYECFANNMVALELQYYSRKFLQENISPTMPKKTTQHSRRRTLSCPSVQLLYSPDRIGLRDSETESGAYAHSYTQMSCPCRR